MQQNQPNAGPLIKFTSYSKMRRFVLHGPYKHNMNQINGINCEGRMNLFVLNTN